MMNPIRAFPMNGLGSPIKNQQESNIKDYQKRNAQQSREQNDPMRRSKSSGIFKANNIDSFSIKPKNGNQQLYQQENGLFQTPTNHQRTKSHNIVQSSVIQREKDQLNTRKIVTNDDNLFKEQLLNNTPQISSTKSQANIYKQPIGSHQKGLFSTKNQNMQSIFGQDKNNDTSGQKLPRIDSGRSNNSNVKRRLNDELSVNNSNGVGNFGEKAILGDLQPMKGNNNIRLSIVASHGQNSLNSLNSNAYNFKSIDNQDQNSQNDHIVQNGNNKIYSQKGIIGGLGGNTRPMFGQPAYRSSNQQQDINKLMNQIGQLKNGSNVPQSKQINSNSSNNKDNNNQSNQPNNYNQKINDLSKDNIQNQSIQYQKAPVAVVEKFVNQVNNFAVKTKAGSLPGMPVKKNQDSSIAIQSYMKKNNKFLFGICDGHGVNGHLASQFIKKTLPVNIENSLKGSSNEFDLQYVKSGLSKAFIKSNVDLIDSGIDVTFSGTTTVVVYLNGSSLYCANIGDSRAINIKQTQSSNDNGKWSVQPLSIDQKPDLDQEMKRIIAKGGRVEPFKDLEGKPLGPSRVWLKNENVPGLAMARSFGDYIAQQVGVISEPEILYQEIDDDDRFIVIASDGIWEFLSNEYVMNQIIPFYGKNDPAGACDKLIRDATNAWKKEDEVVDDITIIIIFLAKKKIEQ